MQYDLNLDRFDITSIKPKKCFVLGIGGGNDGAGAYAIATLIKTNNPQSQVSYGLCVSPKENYLGFKEIVKEGLYVRNPIYNELHNHPSLKLMQTLKKFDTKLGEPYIIITNRKNEEAITKNVIEHFNQQTIITVDNGGDSLTGGKEGEDGFDHKNILFLKKMCIPFYHIVLGLGCDGESNIETIKNMLYLQREACLGEFLMNDIANIFSPMLEEISNPKRKNVDTTKIITDVNNFIKLNGDNEQLYIVPRHERKTRIPYMWINKGIVFQGSDINPEICANENTKKARGNIDESFNVS